MNGSIFQCFRLLSYTVEQQVELFRLIVHLIALLSQRNIDGHKRSVSPQIQPTSNNLNSEE